jgi:hypothetical protein
MDALKAGFAVYVCTGTNSICFGIFTLNLRRRRARLHHLLEGWWHACLERRWLVPGGVFLQSTLRLGPAAD